MDDFEGLLKKVDRIGENDEDFENFLQKVDKISELVKGLNSSDPGAEQKADHYIATLEADEPCRTKINSTKINTDPVPGVSHETQSAESPEQFMKMLERDAEDRKKRKRARREKANVLKDKGNEAYAREDYETAVKYYSDGLAELRDMQPLYTNRAQAFIKLGRYTEAISDCEWALKCNERCIKAYIHMGKAYMALKNYTECRNCYEKIMEIEPSSENMVREYLTQAAMEEEIEKQERDARVESAKRKDNNTVPLLLEKLSKSKQVPLYHCGGLELLSQAITDCTGQTLFRLNKGFSVISNNDTVRSCLSQRSKDPHASELCASVLRLWKVVCNGNHENQKMLMTCSFSSQSAVDLLTSEDIAVQNECLALLCLYSRTPHGRDLVIDNLDLHLLIRNLKVCISKPNKCNQTRALSILENLATEKRFCIQIRDVFSQTVGLPFVSILSNINTGNSHILPALISTVSSLAIDDVIRNHLAHSADSWGAFLVAMDHCSGDEYNKMLYPLLGLMINVSTVTSPAIQEHAIPLCGRCMALLNNSNGEIVSRATGVISNVLPQSPAAVHDIVERGIVRIMHKLLEGDETDATKYAIKTLAACTSVSDLAREEVVRSDKRLSTLRCLLDSSREEVVHGNAALCLSHCMDVGGSATDLLGTDIVLSLLRHAAGDSKRAAVQKNASIALGKLCRAEPGHVNRLRELHGFEILHSCMKLVTAPRLS